MTSGMERKNRPSAADCIFTNDFTNETDCCGAIIPTPGKPCSDALLELETRISKGFSGFPGGTPVTRNEPVESPPSTTRNRLTVNPVRGFESHRLRHIGMDSIPFKKPGR